jgi:hypothetical protein
MAATSRQPGQDLRAARVSATIRLKFQRSSGESRLIQLNAVSTITSSLEICGRRNFKRERTHAIAMLGIKVNSIARLADYSRYSSALFNSFHPSVQYCKHFGFTF